jgi:hypothetical protein
VFNVDSSWVVCDVVIDIDWDFMFVFDAFVECGL